MSDKFEVWLRTVCFQKPTDEAYDLAKCAWDTALELAASVCDTYAKEAETNFVHEKMYAAQGCADAIRALICKSEA